MPADPDTGEIPAVPSPDSAELQALGRILHELENIRYRLGVLVLWFVVLPIVAGIVVWVVLSFNS